jgi:maltose alpha-D-glucosyltransferase/alpha-amylase
MIRMRRESPEIGWGDWRLLDASDEHVLAMHYHWKKRRMLVVHNFASEAHDVHLNDIDAGGQPLLDVLSGENVTASTHSRYNVQMPAYGYRWFRVGGEDIA